ncbi:alginate export family protein [Dyadobacter beijingensis]|uniref:Alginate export family protein n=1 Tax=Dyadobacter beijingensis TaxID=365489 RepID=A0ABQ2ICY8_9BACT|nr:alginate export family protein [Dyadobacter beijingensis]GGN07434.1 alginate export family protein [Dyadobacter beijingensis]
MACLLAVMLLPEARPSYAQEVRFKTLRYEEDYSAIQPDSADFYSQVKHIPLGKKHSYLSLGGEVRYQYFWYKNPGWGSEPEDQDGFMLSRILTHADLHWGNHFRLFAQLQSSFAAGNTEPASPVDENPLDIHQLMMEADLYAKNNQRLFLRMGRQELSYGSQRLISVREGPNSRQSFDAARLIYDAKYLRADAFYANYVQGRKGIFDERFWDGSSQLWGTYVTLPQISSFPGVDLYYLGLSKKSVFADAVGRERRHSLGTRIWKEASGVSFDFEAVYQFGSISMSQIRAWTVSMDASYKPHMERLAPVFGIKSELISGDRTPGDRLLNTFNPLYPRGAYFGLASLIGPYNLTDVHPYVQWEVCRRITWSMDYDLFWRMGREDGLYAVNGALIHDGRGIKHKGIGKQLGTDVNFRPGRFLDFKVEFTWFDTGKFLRFAGLGKSIYMAGFTAAVKY